MIGVDPSCCEGEACSEAEDPMDTSEGAIELTSEGCELEVSRGSDDVTND